VKLKFSLYIFEKYLRLHENLSSGSKFFCVDR